MRIGKNRRIEHQQRKTELKRKWAEPLLYPGAALSDLQGGIKTRARQQRIDHHGGEIVALPGGEPAVIKENLPCEVKPGGDQHHPQYDDATCIFGAALRPVAPAK